MIEFNTGDFVAFWFVRYFQFKLTDGFQGSVLDPIEMSYWLFRASLLDTLYINDDDIIGRVFPPSSLLPFTTSALSPPPAPAATTVDWSRRSFHALITQSLSLISGFCLSITFVHSVAWPYLVVHSHFPVSCHLRYSFFDHKRALFGIVAGCQNRPLIRPRPRPSALLHQPSDPRRQRPLHRILPTSTHLILPQLQQLQPSHLPLHLHYDRAVRNIDQNSSSTPTNL